MAKRELTPEQRARKYAENRERRVRRREERRASEEGRLVLCPICDLWFTNWQAQANHETQRHTPRRESA